MKLNDYLLEIGTEELPSHAVKLLSEALAKNIEDGLDKAKISHGEIQSFGTPRRIAVLVSDLAEMQASQTISRRGPSVKASLDDSGKPLKALIGFAKSCGADIENLTKVKTDKGEWWMYESVQKAVASKDLLSEISKEAALNLPIAKLMTWGVGDFQYSRPIHWIVMKYGDEVISGDVFGVKSGDCSYGHRFHCPEEVKITAPSDYEKLLHEAKVIADFDKRRSIIRSQIEDIASQSQLFAIIPDNLLDEVTSIVEWPNAILAKFDEEFLKVPEEALIESMQHHQKCFAMRDKSNNLSPHFITVTNIESKKPEQVVHGNEKVMKARLSDGAFFFEQDKSAPLSNHIKDLDRVVFHAQLGSLADKTKRMNVLIEYLAKALDLDAGRAKRASELSKCDLLTGMVSEFPELQGLMGYYYSTNDGEQQEVALAIRDHYLPRFSADELPASTLSKALSLADRIDTLVGLFAIGKKPTGVKDPFKLRRHALAVVRILIELPVNLSLSALLGKSKESYGDLVPAGNEFLEPLRTFIFERMQSYYQAKGIDQQFLNAVKPVQNDCLYDVDSRVQALKTFIQIPEAASLAQACKRVTNLLSHKTAELSEMEVDPVLFSESAEKDILCKIEEAEDLVKSYYLARDYANILNCLAGFKTPLDNFFEQVMVMSEVEAVKLNRLCLLNRLQKLIKNVADISLLSI
ncbi:MAG: glycine--tRNA ligase subunit beta [Legionellaceae bacterium]|nr:glycine--tRNA ligase subunit beta [Legionellaceae bacterium]